MESGPVALKDFKPLRSLWTPLQLTSISDIAGWGLGSLSGIELVSSLVKTDLNRLLRMFALIWLSLFKKPSSLYRASSHVTDFNKRNKFNFPNFIVGIWN